MNTSIEKLSPGQDSRRNWRTINDCVDRLTQLHTQNQQRSEGIAELRRRPRDMAGLRAFRITAVESEHYVCRTWDFSAEGTTDLLVARPWEHRNTILSEIIGATTYDYTYTTTTQREADDGASTETQVIVPYLLISGGGQPNPSVIWAIEADTGVEVSGTALRWLDINVAGRAWAAVPA